MKARDLRLPPAGQFLTRDFQGANVLVQVLEDHFIHDGSSYGSLSKVASVITGKTSINGYAFFGLTDTQQRKPKRKAAADTPVLDYPEGLDFQVKDRVLLTTPFGKVYGIISWYTTGRGYDILTCEGVRNSDADNLELVKGDRPEHEILENITECYDGLSGERLTCDGEASAAHIRAQKCSLNRMLIYLFGELGRQVTEDEAYEWASVHSKVNAAVDAVPVTKTVNLSFNVPEDTEITSESLAAMRQLLLSALAEIRHNQVEDFPQLREQHPELVDALLKEY